MMNIIKISDQCNNFKISESINDVIYRQIYRFVVIEVSSGLATTKIISKNSSL